MLCRISEGGIGEGGNYEITSDDYDVAYYIDGERRDLIADMLTAADWCESQLVAIEEQVPGIEFPDDPPDFALAASAEAESSLKS